MTSLRLAVIKGDLEGVLEAEGDPSEAFEQDLGLCCFHYAAMYNQCVILQHLSERESSQKFFEVRSARGVTALMSATTNGCTEATALLLELCKEPAFVNAQNTWGETALHLAAQAGASRCYELLEPHADVTIEDRWGRTAQTVAQECFLGRQEVIQGKSDELQRPARSLSKLIEAPLDERHFVETLLADESVNVAGKDMFGLTAAHKLAAWDKPYALGALLNRQPNLLEAVDAQGNTPLHQALEMGAERAAALLLNRGANTLAVNQAGQTPSQVSSLDATLY